MSSRLHLKKICLVGDCGFSLSDVISEVVFKSFWLMLPGLGPNRQAKIFCRSLVGNCARVKSFEPLMDFLAFLVQKLSKINFLEY